MSRDLKQYYFGKGIESLSDALFYGLDCQKAEWTHDIVQRGSGIMARLNLMFGEKESRNRAFYMEKILIKVNKANVDLVMRLTWYISKAEHKSAIMFHNSRRFKDAFSAIQRALQFYNMHEETYTKYNQKYDFMQAFKTDAQR